ncbi:hypothetical protein SNK03_004297 [Fusarium graminearum]
MPPQQEHDTDSDAIRSYNEESKSEAPGCIPDAMLSSDETSNDVASDISPPPDGGWNAWLCTLCGHFLFMNTWGFINSFGIFQTYYTTFLDRDPSDISWIGSIQVFLSFFVGAFVGRYIDSGHLRLVLSCGTILVLIGIFTASLSTQYWQLILSQGICCGLGNGFLVTPAVSVTSTYFAKRRSLAIGISTCGSVTGALVFNSMARQLLPTAGFGWTMRAIGFVQAATLLFVVVAMKTRLPPTKSGRLVEWVAFKQLDYTFFTIGMFFNFWAVFFGYYYIAPYSRDIVTPNLTYTQSLNLLLILNGVGVFGRMIANHYADTFGPLELLIPTCLVAAVATFSWIAVDTPTHAYVWTVFYGIIGGSILSLFPAGISCLTTDLSTRGAYIGMNFTVISFATLTGNPIAGAIITAMQGKYYGAQAFMGSSFIVGTAFIVAAKMNHAK